MSDHQFNPNIEVWKDISGFPGYQVSDHGRVRSFRTSHGNISSHWKILKPVKNSGGYIQHNLSVDGWSKSVKLHQIVLESFVGPCSPGEQVRHLNGFKAHNHLPNLCWGTALENAQDRSDHGTHKPPCGEKHYRSIFNESHIQAIRYLFSIGFRIATLARMYKAGHPHICHVVYRRSWKHVV
jgi:hypothetical protein